MPLHVGLIVNFNDMRVLVISAIFCLCFAIIAFDTDVLTLAGNHKSLVFVGLAVVQYGASVYMRRRVRS